MPDILIQMIEDCTLVVQKIKHNQKLEPWETSSGDRNVSLSKFDWVRLKKLLADREYIDAVLDHLRNTRELKKSSIVRDRA